MSSTTEGRRLTEAHRLRQLQLRAITARDVQLLWRTLDLEDFARGWASIEPALVTSIQARHQLSAGLSGRYFTEFHAAEGAQGAPSVRLAETPAADVLVPNLRLLGPGTVERTGSLSTAFSQVESEVSRQVLAGGRSTMVESIGATRYCLGYARVSDGSPCAFCAMLISRGAGYGPAAAHFEAHRRCGCTAEPVYRMDQPLPNQAQHDRFSELWNSIPRGLSPSEARAEFRRRYDALT